MIAPVENPSTMPEVVEKKPSVSRIMRTTEKDRHFSRDLKDLFSTLMVSLELGLHRVRFSKIDFSFTVEEAMTNLGSLRSTQTARIPDPRDPNHIITTTSTTTFSMSKEMARSIFKGFVKARFLESLTGSTYSLSRSVVYQMTPKGIAVLQRFCYRNGITAPHVTRLLQSSRNKMHLLILERDMETDRLVNDRATTEVIFRRFAGAQSPTVNPMSSSAWDDRTDYPNGLIGVEGMPDLRVNGRRYKYAFTGKAAVNWLMDCSTTIDERETYGLCGQFIEHGLIRNLVEDKSYVDETNQTVFNFQPTRQAIYIFTSRAIKVCGWGGPEPTVSDETASKSRKSSTSSPSGTTGTGGGGGHGVDISNKSRLNHILSDRSLRLLFREFLGESFCEENLAFYLDITEYLHDYKRSKANEELKDFNKLHDYIARAFSLYNAFLAPGSPCELNLDHNLRNKIATEITGLNSDDELVVASMDEIATLFRTAQRTVFKLMASDSVPKFFRQPRYAQILQEHDFEPIPSVPSRSSSPATVISTKPSER